MEQRYLAPLEQETRVLLAKGGPQKIKRKVKIGKGKKARIVDIFD